MIEVLRKLIRILFRSTKQDAEPKHKQHEVNPHTSQHKRADPIDFSTDTDSVADVISTIILLDCLDDYD